MRAKHLWPCVAICAFVVANRAVAQSSVRWAPNLDIAKKVAAQSNRLILVHFWTEACGPCMRMEREVFSRPDVAAAIEANFVPVRVNVQPYPPLAREYGVDRWPTDIILSPDGRVIERRTGGLDAVQYVGVLNQIAAASRAPSPQQGYARAIQEQGYESPYRRQGGAAPQQPAAPPGPYGGNRPEMQQRMVNQLPTTAPAVQPRPQSWQAETARWNPAASATANSYGAMPSPAQPSAPADPMLAAGVAANPMGQSSAGQAGLGDEAARGRLGVAAQSPPATEPRPSNPPLALEGYCSVALAEKERWIKGDPRYGVIHRGRTYLFSGQDEAKRFFTDPDRYAPVLSGNDVVLAVEENRQTPGKREFGAWYEGRVYLFSTDASLGKFGVDPGRYASAAAQGTSASARRAPGGMDSSPSDPNPGYSSYGSAVRY